MRLPSIKKEPEPEPPVIHVTATGEQRAPARGRGRTQTPRQEIAPQPKPTTRELLGGYPPAQPTYAQQEKGGSDFSRGLDNLLEETARERAKRYEDTPDRDWLKLITGVVFGIIAVGMIALGAILFSLPATPANIAWIHAETAGLAIMLVLLYIKK